MTCTRAYWGDGKEYPRAWNATGNGLEQFSLLRNDTLMALDELSETDIRTADDTIYSIVNGYPKTRAKSTTGGNVTLNFVKTWRIMAISTGEDSIRSFLKINKSKLQKAGQAVRFLDIPADKRKHGAFDDLRGYDKPSELSEAITEASMKYYGTAGRAFVGYLIEQKLDIKALHQQARQLVTDTSTSTEEDRVIKLFSLLCIAGELAIKAQILPWDNDEPLNAVHTGFKLWRQSRGMAGANFAKIHVLNAFKEKTLKNTMLFADNSRSADEENSFNELLGWYINRGTVGADEEFDREYIFLKENINQLTSGRVSNEETAEAFYSINALIHDSNRKTTKRTIKGLGRVRVYVVEASKVYDYLDDNDTEEDEEN